MPDPTSAIPSGRSFARRRIHLALTLASFVFLVPGVILPVYALNITTRVDHVFSDANRLFFRFVYNKDPYAWTSNYPGDIGDPQAPFSPIRVASLSRCRSPPDSVVSGWPRVR